MSYLTGYFAHHAAGRTQPISFTFLQQMHCLPYFRVWPERPISHATLQQTCVHALQQAAMRADWQPESWGDVPLFIGSTGYTLAAYERDPQLPACYDLGELAKSLTPFGQVQHESYATSCTSAANALLNAHAALMSGACERALVLGVESFNLLSFLHFFSLNLLANEYRPFAGDGFVLGEGVAVLALEKTPRSGSLKLLAVAAHTAIEDLARTEADCLQRVMQEALFRAQISPDDIAAVKTHGVGTAASDEAENAALQTLFGRDVPRLNLKPHIGHTLGASGALETALLAERSVDDVAGSLYLANFFGFGGNLLSMVWQRV